MKAVTIFDLKTNNLPVSKFQTLLEQTKNVLFKTASIFPFDLFPDELSIDQHKVNIVTHEFFFSNDIHSIAIDRIKDIQVDTGPFLASITIVPDGYPGRSIVINNLKKKDAIQAQKLIQGLMLIKRKGIDTSELTSLDLKDLETLGHTHLNEW